MNSYINQHAEPYIDLCTVRFIRRKIISSDRLLGAYAGSLVLLIEALVIIGNDLLYLIGICRYIYCLNCHRLYSNLAVKCWKLKLLVPRTYCCDDRDKVGRGTDWSPLSS
ncbi:Uncharacterized protein HZ326_31512 [Fusarium oxysporum f. sp. albedinis]|nr:Uncharacterized protein HZ326_31512 [Fusarium oxysporum f. sp. albedinis]